MSRGWKNLEVHNLKKKKKGLDCLEEIVGRYLDIKGHSGEGLQGSEGHGAQSFCHRHCMYHQEQDVSRHSV